MQLQVVADSRRMLLSWISPRRACLAVPPIDISLTQYRENGQLTNIQKFSKVLASTRVHVEQAIGLLKMKWHRLKHPDTRDKPHSTCHHGSLLSAQFCAAQGRRCQ